jgi:hypothetical protein
MVTARSIENLSGEGELYRENEHLGRVHYWITICQGTLPDERGAEISGISEIIGHLLETGKIDLGTLMRQGGQLTLQLADGRKWDCFLSNSNGVLADQDGRGKIG